MLIPLHEAERDFVACQLQTKAFPSEEALIQEAVRRLRLDTENFYHAVAVGLAEIDAGQALDWDDQQLSSVLEEGLQRAARGLELEEPLVAPRGSSAS
ncbi:MAG: hypothetical protein ACK5O1_05490 [Holosporales bacterium]|jgi:hypothetical protein